MAPYSATGAQSEKFIAMSRRVPPEKGPRLSYGFKALADGGGARPQDGRATPRPPAAGPERRCRSGALRHPRTYGETRCIKPCMPKTKDRDSPPQSGHGDPCARAGSVPGDAAQGGNTDLAPRPACCQIRVQELPTRLEPTAAPGPGMERGHDRAHRAAAQPGEEASPQVDANPAECSPCREQIGYSQ